jgi:hypothetical protein
VSYCPVPFHVIFQHTHATYIPAFNHIHMYSDTVVSWSLCTEQIELVQLPPPADEATKSKQDMLSREVLEIAAVVSAQRPDAHAFERNVLQLKPYFFSPECVVDGWMGEWVLVFWHNVGTPTIEQHRIYARILVRVCE